MSYLETLKNEAETKLKNLSAAVATLERQLAVLVKRAASEKDDLETATETLAQLKNEAGAYLTDGSNAFDRFKTNLKRTTARVETLRESIQIFDRELVPGKTRELMEAREKLATAFSGLYVAARPVCEAEMARLLDRVVVEHDEFMTAFEELRKVYGGSYSGHAPRVPHRRLAEVMKLGLTKGKALVFTRAPAAAPADAAPAVPAVAAPAAISDVPMPAREESVASDAPRAVALAPDNAGKPQEAAPVAPDPLPLDVDAEVEAELDVEAPPDAGEKENPGIAAESS